MGDQRRCSHKESMGSEEMPTQGVHGKLLSSSPQQAREPLRSHSVSLSFILAQLLRVWSMPAVILLEGVSKGISCFLRVGGKMPARRMLLSFFIPGCLVSQHRL